MTSDTPNHTSSKQNLATKKAAVLGSSPAGSRSPASGKVLLIACALVAMVMLLLLFTHSGPKDSRTEASVVTPVNGELLHPAALFADGQARHFVLRTEDGVGIRYFVLQTPDGLIRTAFDACDVCWQADMGYVQDGDVMICRNCGMRFPSRIIGEVRGGCNPTPLASQVREGDLVIRAGDVLEGRRYFDFGPGSGRG
jgi:uncharacterized membrane protein